MNTGFLKKLSRQRSAVFGVVIILITSIAAVFAYFIAPDHSPFANRIIPEIANQKPGFSISFLQIKKIGAVEKPGILNRLVNGLPDSCDFIPIMSSAENKDSIIAQKYIDENLTERIAIPKAKLTTTPVIKKTFLLGTDKFGRDILSRLIIGSRVSLSVGLITVLISLGIGIFLGLIAGYYGGKTDKVIMWFVNVIWSIPTLLFVFALTLILGKGFWQVFVAVGLTMWVNVARLVRGQALEARELEYVEAARALGFSNTRIIFRHILPNILGPVMVIAAANFAAAILIEAGLSFLGIGVQPPQPSWGLMIRENYNFIITGNPMAALEPGIAIMFLVLAFNLLGNGLRDAMQVK
ncbi:MAG: ABC transporter permease [Chitinophagaceae bacterium]